MHRVLLHICVLLFAMSAWLSINTMYVELPILSAIVPESWNFATYIVATIQVSCLFPLLYSILRMKRPSVADSIDVVLVFTLLAVDVVGLLCASFTYTLRTPIFGAEHSTWLIVSLLILCIPCTMADVVFLPFMARLGYSSSLVTTFYIGMGFGAFAPSALSFAQGSPTVEVVNGTNSTNPDFIVHANFSFNIFIYIVCGLVGISFIAFLALYRHSLLLQQSVIAPTDSQYISSDEISTPRDEASVEESEGGIRQVQADEYLPFLLAISLIAGAFQNAVLPSIISYAAAPYGNNVYHLTTTLFVVTNPLFCLLQHVYTFSSPLLLSLLSLLSALPSLFIIVLACLPTAIPWTGASTLLLISSGLSAGLLSLLRTAAASRLACSSDPRALFLCGLATQAGSFVGAVIIFVLANVFHVFPAS